MVQILVARTGQTWIDFFRHHDKTYWSNHWKTECKKYGQSSATLDALTQHGHAQSLQLGESVYAQLFRNMDSSTIAVHSIEWFSSCRNNSKQTLLGAIRGFQAFKTVHQSYTDSYIVRMHESPQILSNSSVRALDNFDKVFTLESLIAPDETLFKDTAKAKIDFFSRTFSSDIGAYLRKSAKYYQTHVTGNASDSTQSEFFYDFERMTENCYPAVCSFLHKNRASQLLRVLTTIEQITRNSDKKIAVCVTDEQTMDTIYRAIHNRHRYDPRATLPVQPIGYIVIDMDACSISVKQPVHSYQQPLQQFTVS
jgi:hypothetical protein